VCYVVHKTTSELECMILTTPFLAGAKNIDSWCARKGELQCAFPLDVPMVPTSVITVAADGERLSCGGFSLGESVCFWNFEFIADYFDGLTLSPKRSNSGTAFMGSTCRGASSPRWVMIEDSAKEFLTASSRDERFGLPSPMKRDTGASLAPVTTTPWMENTPAAQATMMVPLWTATPRSETSLPSERCHTRHGKQQTKARARQPIAEPGATPWRSWLTGKQASTTVQMHTMPRHELALEAEKILMVDVASTQAQAKEVAPPASREGGGRLRSPRRSLQMPHRRSPPTGWTRCTIN
jgi:hypothetical protein